MPNDLVAELIAHEMAHAYQFTYLRTGQGLDRDDAEWEREAWKIEYSWGFDPNEVCAWYFKKQPLIECDGQAS